VVVTGKTHLASRYKNSGFLPDWIIAVTDNVWMINVGRIDYHVQGTKPNAVSAFPQSISSARTQLNTITFTHLTQLHITISRAVLRVLGKPTINEMCMD
jgi:hypothetical protein